MPFLPSSSCHVALFWYLVFKVITVLTVFRDETASTERRRAVTSQISNLFFRIYVFQKRFAFSLRDSLVRPGALLILIFTNWKVKIRNCERHESWTWTCVCACAGTRNVSLCWIHCGSNFFSVKMRCL